MFAIINIEQIHRELFPLACTDPLVLGAKAMDQRGCSEAVLGCDLKVG